jgi:hypothetical protein
MILRKTKFIQCIGAWVLLLSSVALHAQELDFDVKVVVQGNVTSDPSLFKTLEKNIYEFLNTTKWTDDLYENHERIKGSIQINLISEPSSGIFTSEMVVQTDRPVYNSMYRSPIINIIDNHVNFSFTGLLPLVKTKSVFVDNLSSILSFYAYMTIGLDKDTFSPYGGEAEYLNAQEVVSSLGMSVVDDEGWTLSSGTKRNRYWFLNNILHPRLRPFRQALYEYHRVCLDKMYDDADKARAIMLSSITSIGQVELDYPSSMLIQSFGDAKKDELIEIFKVADKGSKNKVKTIMVGLDASKKERYNALN